MCEAYPRPFAPRRRRQRPAVEEVSGTAPHPAATIDAARAVGDVHESDERRRRHDRGRAAAGVRYLVHGMLRTGNAGVQAALLRLLLARTCASDLRIIEALLSGGDASLLHALLPLLQPDGAAAATALLPPPRRRADAQPPTPSISVLLLRLLGRVAALGARRPPRAPPTSWRRRAGCRQPGAAGRLGVAHRRAGAPPPTKPSLKPSISSCSTRRPRAPSRSASTTTTSPWAPRWWCRRRRGGRRARVQTLTWRIAGCEVRARAGAYAQNICLEHI